MIKLANSTLKNQNLGIICHIYAKIYLNPQYIEINRLHGCPDGTERWRRRERR